MQQGHPPEAEDGTHGPYYMIDTTGMIYQIDEDHVARDYCCAFPHKTKTWLKLCEEGGHAFFNSESLRSRRRLVPRAITVLTNGAMSTEYENQMQYVWCVRCSVTTGDEAEAPFYGSTTGTHFLWPLGTVEAKRYYEELKASAHFATSRLVTDFAPESKELNPCAFPSSTMVQSMDSYIERAFAASISPVTSDACVEVAKPEFKLRLRNPVPPSWHVPNDPGKKRVAVRRPTPRGCRLFDKLDDDTANMIWEQAAMAWVGNPCVVTKSHQLALRRVCRASRLAVDTLCVNWVVCSTAVAHQLKICPSIRHVIGAREHFVWAGVPLFSALVEFAAIEDKRLLGEAVAGPARQQLLLAYMRLHFNKPCGAQPPPPPEPEPEPEPMVIVTKEELARTTPVVMSLTHNKRKAEGVEGAGEWHAYSTRRAKEQRRVRMKMLVPPHFRAWLAHVGWESEVNPVG